MNGGTSKTVIKFFVFLVVVSTAGTLFWYLRDVPASYSLTASPEEIDVAQKGLSLLIVGDIMLDRNVRNMIDKAGFIAFFSGVKTLVSGTDLAVGNLEGPFTHYPSITANLKSKDLVFTFDPTLAPYLTDLGFDVLGLANNHTLNFGETGMQETKHFIQDAGMLYYGDPNNKNEISTVVQKNGIGVGLVGFHEFSYRNFDKVLAEIDRLRPDVDVLIVSPHWGVEYQSEPTASMKKWAREFIDHGADAVIGSHPHVIGEIEEYNGKKIYYSLGNFAFDQYFSEETSKGLVVKIGIVKDLNKNIVIKYENNVVHIDKQGIRVYN